MRFVVIASPRTGSSHLVDLLNNQDDILCNGEIFHKDRVFVKWPKEQLDASARVSLKQLRSSDPSAFLSEIYAKNFGKNHVGFKIFEKHNPSMLETVVDDSSILKIILFRRNVLATYSSALIANETGKWDFKKLKRAITPNKVLFEPKKFIRFHARYTKFYRTTLAGIVLSNQTFRFINYDEVNDETLFSGLVAAIRGCNSEIRFKSSHLKQNSSNIILRFSNPDDVERFLTQNGLMHWAYEGNTSMEALSEQA